MTDLAMVVNKRKILYWNRKHFIAIGATYAYVRMLKTSQLHQDILRGNVIPNIQLHLEGSEMNNIFLEKKKLSNY